MPITLPAFSRRTFLSGSLAAGAGLILPRGLRADDAVADPNRFALMADTHIAADREAVVRGAHLSNHLKQAGQEIVSAKQLAAAAIINGDCAYNTGESGDYGVLAGLLSPIRAGGVGVHLTMGNHDHRERFWQAIPEAHESPPIVNRHITVLPSPHANWFLLDSLERTNHTPGTLGQQQLDWLTKALAAHQDKPALIVAHHNPDVRERTSGLTDTAALFDVLRAHKQVKAYVFGHTHQWDVQPDKDGIYRVNLPPVAYVFRQGNPSGWVDARLTAAGASLRLNCLDKSHPKHGETIDLTWRT